MSVMTDNVLTLLRTQVAGTTDDFNKIILFEVVSEFCREVLQITQPSTPSGQPDTWLSNDLWVRYHLDLVAGTMARLQVQEGKPWSNVPAAQANYTLYKAAWPRSRAANVSVTSAASALWRIQSILFASLPNAPEASVGQMLYRSVDYVRREVLQIAPVPQNSEPSTWFTEDQYAEHMSLVLDGALAALYGQVGQAWGNAELAKAHALMWAEGRDRAREHAAAAPVAADGYTRIMNNLRTNFPQMRDSALGQELFNTVDELTRNILQVTPPDQNSAPSSWLPAEKWDEDYRLIYAGAMVRILTQPGKPWTDPKLAAFHQAQWESLSTLARADATRGAKPDPTERLLGNLRSQLPGAKDSQIKQALFNVVLDACQRGFIWQEEVPVFFTAAQRSGDVTPPDTQIVLVQNVYHPEVDARGYQFDNGKFAIVNDPPAGFHQQPFVFTMALAPLVTSDLDYPITWVPYDIWSKYHNLLLYGVLANMMLQPAKPYSNTQLGQFNARLYARDLNNATVAIKDRGLPAKQHWSFPRFA